MANIETVLQQIEKELGSEKILVQEAELETWAVDGLIPRGVVFPETIKEISLILRIAHEANVAVIPYGQGTKMGLGGIPRRADLVLSTTRYARVIDYDIPNFTLTAETGLSLEAVQQLVHPHRQFFPLDPPFPAGSLGGIVATNASGPKRLAYGSLRDLILGIRVVLPHGEILKCGGKVMKNVAGFDLAKLYIGSLGTLGVLGEVTLKLLALPEQEKVLFLAFPDIEKASGFLAQVLDSYLLPSALELLDARTLPYLDLPQPSSPHTVGLLISFEGLIEAVEREVRETDALATQWHAGQREVWEGEERQSLWRSLADLPGRLEQDYPKGIRCKLSIPPARIKDTWQQVYSLGQEKNLPVLCFGRGGSGILYTCLLLESLEEGEQGVALINELGHLVSGQQGFLTVETAPSPLKVSLDVWGPARSTLPLMKSLKAKFDPRAILNPGRFVGGI